MYLVLCIILPAEHSKHGQARDRGSSCDRHPTFKQAEYQLLTQDHAAAVVHTGVAVCNSLGTSESAEPLAQSQAC
jgi:hypothetical protein